MGWDEEGRLIAFSQLLAVGWLEPEVTLRGMHLITAFTAFLTAMGHALADSQNL